MHEEIHVVGKVVLAHRVYLETMRNFVKVFFANATYETARLKLNRTIKALFIWCMYHEKECFDLPRDFLLLALTDLWARQKRR